MHKIVVFFHKSSLSLTLPCYDGIKMFLLNGSMNQDEDPFLNVFLYKYLKIWVASAHIL